MVNYWQVLLVRRAPTKIAVAQQDMISNILITKSALTIYLLRQRLKNPIFLAFFPDQGSFPYFEVEKDYHFRAQGEG
jgi:hypothetical protein